MCRCKRFIRLNRKSEQSTLGIKKEATEPGLVSWECGKCSENDKSEDKRCRTKQGAATQEPGAGQDDLQRLM